MARLWAVVRREYLERVRTRWFAVSTLLAPLLFGAIILLPLYFSQRSGPAGDVARVVVIDATGSGLGRRVAAELNGGVMGDTTITPVVETTAAALARAERDAARRVLAREVKGYLVLGAGVLETMRARYSGTNASAEADMRRLSRIVEGEVMAVRLERAGIPPHDARALTARDFELDAQRLTEGGRGGSGRVRGIFAFTVAVLLYFAIFLYGQNVLRGVMEEKQTRVAEIVVSSVPATQLMAGKVIGVGAVGLTQLLLSAGGSYALYRARAPVLARLGLPPIPWDLPHIPLGTALLLIAFFLLGYAFYAALFAAIGAMVSSEQEAQQVQLPVAMMLVASALFIQPVLMAPESALAVALSLIPVSAPIIMPLRLSLVPVPASEIALALVAIAVGTAAVTWLAARIYRTGLLLYGKRPTLRELARWVRVAR
jgi:ABC-2 type transport system permease protein